MAPILGCDSAVAMATSRQGNAFRIRGLLWSEQIPLTKVLVCSFDTLFDISLNKLIGKQWSFRWDTRTPIWSHIYVCRNIKMAYHDTEQIQ